MYFIGRVIDIEKYYNVFFVISAVCIVFTLFYYLHYVQTAKNMAEVAGDDNMYTAYRVLPHILNLPPNSCSDILAILLTFMGVLFLFSCGTRGPILCLVFFGVFYFLFFMNFKHAFIVKGIMTVKGALKAKEAGASAIIVSNHGGRVLDQCPATAEVLESIVKALEGSGIKILVDGGIRSGTDVFKALALGADGVLIARPFVTAVYGGKADGVRAYIDKIGTELEDTMKMCGVSSLDEITRDCVMTF